MIAAARHPHVIRKLVVWGANAFVSQQDLTLYNGNLPVSSQTVSTGMSVLPHNCVCVCDACPCACMRSGPRRLQVECEDEEAHGGVVWSRSLR